ncbi:MAG: OmpA family protein [Anaerolineales bacterium]
MTKVPPKFACQLPPNSPPFVTEKIDFPNKGTALTKAHKALLEQFVMNWYAAGANMNVRVDGFASKLGTDELNWKLSCERAKAVEAELLAPSSGTTMGIPSTFLATFAQGETDEFGAEKENRCVTLFVPMLHTTPPRREPPKEEPPKDEYLCGPDITDPLIAVLGEVRSTWSGWSGDKKRESCDELTSVLKAFLPFFKTSGFIMAWDIHELFLNDPSDGWLRLRPYHPPCGIPGASGADVEDDTTCSNSVQVREMCFLAGTVNYAIFGQMCQLCNTEFGDMSEDKMVSLIGAYKLIPDLHHGWEDPGPPKAWARAGYRGFPGNVPMAGNRPKCATHCRVPYSGNPFTWVWEPHHPR